MSGRSAGRRSGNGFLAYQSERFLRITTPVHLDEINGSGKLGMILGLQNSTHFRTPDDVNVFHSLGQRVSQLTYNSQNRIGTGSMDRHDGGISDFGAQIGGRYRDQYKFRDKIDMDEMPTQKRTYLLTEGLIRRGYGDEDIKLILGGNFALVLKEIWSV